MSNQVALTILNQIGGANRLVAMINASSFASGNFAKVGEPDAYGVSFRIGMRAKKGIKAVIIKLNGRDLYDVEFGKMVNFEYKVVDSASDIYAEDLRDLIERTTGLALRL